MYFVRLKFRAFHIVFNLFFLIFFSLVLALDAIPVQEKTDATVPVTTLSPPEGNTTFLDGTNWCVARPGVPQTDLQNALDWACGLGMTDCGPIRHGGPCFQPDTLLSHASFAFNSYYQKNGNSDIACNFGGTSMLTNKNPSKYSPMLFQQLNFSTNELVIVRRYIILSIFHLARMKCVTIRCESSSLSTRDFLNQFLS